jgi:eukaryotic-like serine/threonine-protein kinase
MTASSDSPTISLAAAGFLAAVRAADLFAPMQLARVEAAVPPDVATAAETARALIAAGFLTRFQAERLLAGKADGFHLGPYVILEQIGRGATGRVYKARHRTMNRPVAVKVLSADLTRTPAARQAYQREVRAAAQLNHPNIVTAYDANELAERFYLVLEFVDGPNFEILLRERGPLPISEACELVRQAAVGLDHAHSLKMLHRDIKPANLLVARPSKTSPDYHVKIADFGIAKLSSAQTPQVGGSCVGTPDYIAPEQAHNPAAADHRADLYSLGAVLYFLLTGRPPFPGGTAEDKVRRHLWEEPARIEVLRRDLPPMLSMLVHQLLAKNPAHRPDSAAEVVERLGAIATSFGDAVSFDLAGAHQAQHSFVAGPLSGGHTIPTTSNLEMTPCSGRYPLPVALPTAPETSPWADLTVPMPLPDDETEEEPHRRSQSRQSASMPMWIKGGLAVGLCLLCVAAGVLIKAMAK